MSANAKVQAGAVVWSLVVAVVITGLVHAMAFNLPDWMSARASRQASALENSVAKFSETWMGNAFVYAGIVAGVSFLLAFPFFLWRFSATARNPAATVANPNGSGAG